jgi:hypothetical protein
MVGALLSLAGAVLLIVLMGLLALTVLIAKIAVFGLFLLAPFAAVVGILPGAGRRLAWVWVASVGQTTLIVVGSGLLLSLMMIVQISLTEAVGTVGEVGLVGRFASFDLVTFTAIMARRRFLGGLQSFTNQLFERLTRATPGGEATASPLAPAAAGTNFMSIDRAGGRGVFGSVVPTALFLNQRLGERRNAHRSLDNLWRVQAYQEQRDYGRVLMNRDFVTRALRPVPRMRWRRVDVPRSGGPGSRPGSRSGPRPWLRLCSRPRRTRRPRRPGRACLSCAADPSGEAGAARRPAVPLGAGGERDRPGERPVWAVAVEGACWSC